MSTPREHPAGLPGDGDNHSGSGVEPAPGLPSIGTNPGQYEDGRGSSREVPVHVQPLRPAQAQPPTEPPPPDHVQGGD